MAANEPTANSSLTIPQPLHWGDFLTINFLFGGTSFLWGALPVNVLALLVPILGITQGGDNALAFLLILGQLVTVLVQPIAGAFSDRLAHQWGRRRPLMLVGTLASLVWLALMAWTLNQPLTHAGIRLSWLPLTDNADYWLIALLYIGLQAGVNLAQAAAQGLIPDLVPSAQRGAAAGVKTFIEQLVTFVLIAMLVPGIYASSANQIVLGSQNLILVIGGVLFVTLISNFIAIRETPLKPQALPSLRETARHAFKFDTTRDAEYINLLVTRLFCLAGFAIFLNFSGFYFRDLLLANQPNAADLATAIQSSLLYIIGISALVVSIPVGALSDRIGRKPITAIGGLLAALGTFGLLLVRNNLILNLGAFALTDLGLVAILIGVGLGLFHTASWAWATELVPSEEAARYLGLAYIVTVGALVLAYLGGVLLEVFNASQPGSGFNVLFILAAVWLGLGALLALRVRETRGKNAILPAASPTTQ